MSKTCPTSTRPRQQKSNVHLDCWEEECRNYPQGLTTSASYSVWSPKTGSNTDAIITPNGKGSLALYPANTFRGVNAVDFRHGNAANTDIGNRTIAGGEGTGLDGDNNFVTGFNNSGKGDNNILSGNSNSVTDDSNIVSGQENIVKGDVNAFFPNIKGLNIVSGYQNNITGNANLVVGGFSTIVNNPADPVQTGDANIVGGGQHTIIGPSNLVIGGANTVKGAVNMSGGNGNKIYGTGNFVNGYENTLGDETTFFSQANFITGYSLSNEVNNYSLLMGYGGKAITSAHDLDLGDCSLQIAKGSSPTDATGVKVMIGIDSTGIGIGYTDHWHSTGIDYAEYFELAGPVYLTEDDRIGYFVYLDFSGKATGSKPIGTFSSKLGTPGIIGGAAYLHWDKLYKRDKFGRRLTETSIKDSARRYVGIKKFLEVNGGSLNDTDLVAALGLSQAEIDNLVPGDVAVINPAYNPSVAYIPRENRPEWGIVSLLGKVIVRDDGTCVVGQKCSCSGGIAVPGTDWIVMERMSADTILILFK